MVFHESTHLNPSPTGPTSLSFSYLFCLTHTYILKRQNKNKKIRIEQSKLARKEMKEKAGEPQIDTESHMFSNTRILLKHKTESLFELKYTE